MSTTEHSVGSFSRDFFVVDAVLDGRQGECGLRARRGSGNGCQRDANHAISSKSQLTSNAEDDAKETQQATIHHAGDIPCTLKSESGNWKGWTRSDASGARGRTRTVVRSTYSDGQPTMVKMSICRPLSRNGKIVAFSAAAGERYLLGKRRISAVREGANRSLVDAGHIQNSANPLQSRRKFPLTVNPHSVHFAAPIGARIAGTRNQVCLTPGS